MIADDVCPFCAARPAGRSGAAMLTRRHAGLPPEHAIAAVLLVLLVLLVLAATLGGPLW